MKQLLFTTFLLFTISLLSAQTINYQGALRDANGDILSDEVIDLRIGIYDGGNKLFEENHTNISTTNQGLFNIKIGESNPSLFVQLDFAKGLLIKTEIRTNGSYQLINEEPLSAVPIALQALSVENNEDADADPENEIQTLYANGNTLGITGGNEIQFGGDADPDPFNELQDLSINGNALSISNGNEVQLPEELDADPENELQNLNYADGRLQLTQSTQSFDFDTRVSLVTGWEKFSSNITLRSNNHNVGIGLDEPAAKLHVVGGADATLIGGGALIIGNKNFNNLVFDGNEIICRADGGPSNLSLNKGSGDVFIAEGGGQIFLGLNGGGNTTMFENAFHKKDVLVDGNVGIGTNNPLTKLHIPAGQDVSLTLDGYLMLGPKNGINLILDNNEIQARVNGAPAPLNLNYEGGGIKGIIYNIGDHRNMQYNPTTREIGFDNSSRRYKTNIQTLEDDWHKILNARPVKYTRPQSPEYWEFGYIAEEMDSIGMSNLVFKNEEGLVEDYNYEKMIIYVTEMVKINHQKITALEETQAALVDQRRLNAVLTAENQTLKNALEEVSNSTIKSE